MIGVLDYGMGNLHSVTNALDFLGCENLIVEDELDFKRISRLIIPGVGSFAAAMDNLKKKGYIEPILDFAASNKPILGICLGMQLLATKGTEPHEMKGLGLLPGSVERFNKLDLQVPHMGWNGIQLKHRHPIFNEVKLSADFYFVHSFHYVLDESDVIIATTEYGYEFPSVVGNKNVIGIQFHPEKSQKQGLRILENFNNL